MKKYFCTITTILILVLGLLSCSNEETKTQNQIAARPTVPLQNGEVQIGTQIWMTKNLNVSRYRNGDPIPQVTNATQWRNLGTGAWCYYQNNSANGTVYGKLYNWYAVNDSRGLAPAGWHVPSDNEWTILTTFLGGESIAGNKMKATIGWASYSGIINSNSSGFAGLPGGYREFDGAYYYKNYIGFWYSSSQNLISYAWSRSLKYDGSEIRRYYPVKKTGKAIRCIKD